MKKELFFKIIKGFICALLSVVFVLGMVALPLYYSITALAKPETVAMVVQEIDYKEVITKNPTLKKSLETYGITPNEADMVMKSKEAGEVLEAYTDRVTQAFLETSEDKELNVSHLKDIALENADEFIELAEKKTNLKFDNKKTKQTVSSFFENNEVVIEESIQVIKEVKDVVKTLNVTQIMHKKFSLVIAFVSVAIVFVIFAIIIALMRSYGFLWIGIDFGVISIILAVVVGFIKSGFVSSLVSQMPLFGSKVFESAITVSSEKIIITLFATIIMTVMFIGFFVALKLLKRKYQKTSINE